ncbi:MAG: Nif3-like dinuclear metal center hexameric protein [Bacilli bacterium]|nr:Nif3-like dinuclear metal center hexameric protein [Bacilli bacterium]
MQSSKLIYHLRKWYPKSVACPGDFIGLQTGKLRKETNTILVCLDFDNDVFNRVKREKIDLILTHHPLIYGKRKEVLEYDSVKRALVKKIDKLKIPVYSMHTNFDSGLDGMNDNLAKAIGLKNIKSLKADPMIRGGVLKEAMEVNAFARFVKKSLNLPSVYLINRGKKMVKKVAICGGAAGGCFKMALDEGYDIYVSGDAPHHIRHDVNCYQFNYLEIWHEAEQIFIPVMVRRLKALDKKLKIITVSQPYPKVI